MKAAVQVKVADEVWIATAQLHKNRPDAIDFTVDEILEQATAFNGGEPLRPGVYVHAIQHCVANRAPSPGRYRMLYETGDGRRRLYRTGDPFHPKRADSKIVPANNQIPSDFNALLGWKEICSESIPVPGRRGPWSGLNASGNEV